MFKIKGIDMMSMIRVEGYILCDHLIDKLIVL